jgi:hypothetical protein
MEGVEPQILTAVRKEVAALAKRADFSDDADWTGELGLDSLDFVEMAWALEDQYAIGESTWDHFPEWLARTGWPQLSINRIAMFVTAVRKGEWKSASTSR